LANLRYAAIFATVISSLNNESAQRCRNYSHLGLLYNPG
jgi:hypothetical protein